MPEFKSKKNIFLRCVGYLGVAVLFYVFFINGNIIDQIGEVASDQSAQVIEASTVTVSNAADFETALNLAHRNKIIRNIRLSPGQYIIDHRINLFSNPFNASNKLTITSADANNRAELVFTNGSYLYFNQLAYIDINKLKIRVNSVPKTSTNSVISIQDSNNINISDVEMRGYIVQEGEGVDKFQYTGSDEPIVGYPYGGAIGVIRSSDIHVDKANIYDFMYGVSFAQNSNNLSLTNSHLHYIRTDFVRLYGVQDVLIDNNQLNSPMAVYFEEGMIVAPKDADHADYIQYAINDNDNYNMDNITISNNVIIQAGKLWAQSIFGHTGEYTKTDQLQASDFKIFNNVVVSDETKGIRLGGIQNSKVHHNTLIRAGGHLDPEILTHIKYAEYEHAAPVIQTANYWEKSKFPGLHLESININDNIIGYAKTGENRVTLVDYTVSNNLASVAEQNAYNSSNNINLSNNPTMFIDPGQSDSYHNFFDNYGAIDAGIADLELNTAGRTYANGAGSPFSYNSAGAPNYPLTHPDPTPTWPIPRFSIPQDGITIVDPTVSISGLSNNQTVTTDSITVEAIANNFTTVTRVEFFIDGTLVRTEASAPYSLGGDSGPGNLFAYDLSSLATGAHTLRVVVTGDGQTVEDSVNFTISRTVTVPAAPAVNSWSVADSPTDNRFDITLINVPAGVDSVEVRAGSTGSPWANFTTSPTAGNTYTMPFSTNPDVLVNVWIRYRNSAGVSAVSALKPVTVSNNYVTCTSFAYSAWGACQSNGTQTRTVTSGVPSGCVGGSPVTTQSCTYVPPVSACTSHTYSAWGACQSNGTQVRTLTSSLPASCSGGVTPVLSQACTYTPTCTAFSYSAWGTCLPNGTQTRTVSGTTPTSCVGGSPSLSRSCTYTPPVVTPPRVVTKDAYLKSKTDSLVSFNLNDKGKDTCSIIAFDSVEETDLVTDADYDYEIGLFDMSIDCVGVGETVTFQIALDQTYDTSNWVYRKFNPSDNTYTTIPDTNITYSTANGVTVVEYEVTDGGPLDQDGVANGVIVDPAGPAILVNPPETTTTNTGSGSGGGSSSGGSSSGGGSRTSKSTDTEETVDTPVVESTPQSASPYNYNSADLVTKNISFIQPQYNEVDQVKNIERFLNTFEGESLPVDGIYSNEDNEAVKRFQKKYQREILDIWNLSDATGYVGVTTRLKMNFLMKGQVAECPVFTEFNGGLNGITFSSEVGETQKILRDLDMYSGPIDNTWSPQTHEALVVFQETFREVMLDPWNITEGTGYKYKTTNKFLNYFAGCDTGSVFLEGVGEYEGI